jgi:pimeloyl-ACP methyl ester carboxylesterase
VLTNCDTAGRFPPPPFDLLVRAGRLPGALPLAYALTRLGPLGRLGYSPLAASPIDPAQARAWLAPGRAQPGVRRDLRRFLRAIDPDELTEVAGRLDRFAGPVLVAWAPEDPYFRIEDGRRLAASFRSARVVEVPGSRTFVPLDQPAALADEVIAFCRSADAPGAPEAVAEPTAVEATEVRP